MHGFNQVFVKGKRENVAQCHLVIDDQEKIINDDYD